LLNAYDIKTPLTSYYEHNKQTKLGYILRKLEEVDVALVSEAGTPGISDPGYELIVAAGEQGIPVVAVPGPSAIIAALAVSGLPTDRFTYIGFLPRKRGERRKLLESVADESGSIVILEAPHRMKAALDDIIFVLGDRRIAICRQLTKLHEEVFRGTVSRAQQYFTEPKGEFTLVIEGNKGKQEPEASEEIIKRMEAMKTSGSRAREAIALLAEETGLSRKELYRAWLKL